MATFQQEQPDLWELLDADQEFMEHLVTQKPTQYHKTIIERLTSLIVGTSETESRSQYLKDQYRRDARELYRRNLLSLSRV